MWICLNGNMSVSLSSFNDLCDLFFGGYEDTISDLGMDLVNSGRGIHMMLCMKAFWGVWEHAFTETFLRINPKPINYPP